MHNTFIFLKFQVLSRLPFTDTLDFCCFPKLIFMKLGLYGGAKIKFQKRKKANCVDIEDVSLEKLEKTRKS